MFSGRSNGSRTRTQPSHYSPLPFHIVRIASLLSSLVVSAIMFYFIYHLRHDHFKTPWTFLLLLGVSLLTLLILTFTNALHFCHVLSPRLSMVLNTPLLILWMLGFSLLTWNMSGTLTHVCNRQNWGNSDGVMICRVYKALFSFACIGLVSAFATVALDIRTRRKQLRLGNYAMMNGGVRGEKVPRIAVEPMRGDSPPPPPHMGHQYQDSINMSRGGGREGGYEGYDSRAPVEYNGAPVGAYGNEGAWKSQQQMRAEDFGYGAPSEQTRYDGPGAYGGR